MWHQGRAFAPSRLGWLVLGSQNSEVAGRAIMAGLEEAGNDPVLPGGPRLSGKEVIRSAFPAW